MISKSILIVFVALAFCFTFNDSVTAQQSALPLFIARFDEYKKNNLDEKVFVHIDRSFYITGETMWFKLYYMDGSYHRPLNISKVGYIEVIDKDQKVVLQSKIMITDDGTGNGSLFIPASLNSGRYHVRAYTSWMKNYSAELFFEQTITVVNPFTALGIKESPVAQKYDVQFFPEGGNLVEGLTSVVACRVVDHDGEAIDYKGAIVDNDNDTIARFKPLKFGLGKFTFTPRAGGEYKAIVYDAKHTSATYKFPAVADGGFVMTVSDSTSNELKITVKVNVNVAGSIPVVYMIARTRQLIKISEMKFIQDNEVAFSINKNLLGEGVSHITLFDYNMNPVCERLYFKRPESNTLSITLQHNQTKYVARKRINFSVTTATDTGIAVPANMSVAVYNIDSLQSPTPTLRDYVWLTSELKGTIASPAYYFGEDNAERKEATDNLMLTHGWRRFRWEDTQSKVPTLTYIPECGGHVITGQVTDKLTGLPARGIFTYISSPGKLTRLYASRSDENGMIMFEMQNFFGSDEVIAQTNTVRDSTYHIEIFSPYADNFSTTQLPRFEFSKTLKTSLEQRSIHMQVQNIFSEKEIITPKQTATDSAAFFGKSDEHYRLDDYTRFPTMEEVMREYVPGVMVRKRRDGFHFINLDQTNKSVFKNDPLVLIDGVPVFNTDRIMDFDPRKIKSIDVITRKYYLGSLALDGIVSYKTYRGDLGSFQLDPRAFVINYEGLQLQQEFFSPQYETPQQRENPLPDVRNLLYWSPNVNTNSEGQCQFSFYSSDVTGKYQVVIEGMDKEGRVGNSTTTFEVRDKVNY